MDFIRLNRFAHSLFREEANIRYKLVVLLCIGTGSTQFVQLLSTSIRTGSTQAGNTSSMSRSTGPSRRVVRRRPCLVCCVSRAFVQMFCYTDGTLITVVHEWAPGRAAASQCADQVAIGFTNEASV